MGILGLLLVLAVIALLVGLFTAAKWLIIIAVVLAVVGLVSGAAGRRGSYGRSRL